MALWPDISVLGGMSKRRPYPTDVSDGEWHFAAPYLTLMNNDAPRRRYEPREMFNALRWIVRAGAPWRPLPNDLPPRETPPGKPMSAERSKKSAIVMPSVVIATMVVQ